MQPSELSPLRAGKRVEQFIERLHPGFLDSRSDLAALTRRHDSNRPGVRPALPFDKSPALELVDKTDRRRMAQPEDLTERSDRTPSQERGQGDKSRRSLSRIRSRRRRDSTDLIGSGQGERPQEVGLTVRPMHGTYANPRVLSELRQGLRGSSLAGLMVRPV